MLFFSTKRGGFTLIELIVAVSLFSVVVSIAAGGFVSALRTQRQSSALTLANSNVSLALEQMSREIRTGKNFGCVGSLGGAETPSTCSNGLAFTNANGESVAYCPDGAGGIVRALNSDCAAGEEITSDSVIVNYLLFRLVGTSGGQAPARVTILLGVGPREKEISGNVLNLETTVSSRFLGS